LPDETIMVEGSGAETHLMLSQREADRVFTDPRSAV
jgi:hypothetical protein